VTVGTSLIPITHGIKTNSLASMDRLLIELRHIALQDINEDLVDILEEVPVKYNLAELNNHLIDDIQEYFTFIPIWPEMMSTARRWGPAWVKVKAGI
jgi:hypothetical protein